MADSNFGGPLHGAYSIAPTPPALRPQEPDTLSSAYANYSPYPAYEAQAYNHFAGPLRPQLPHPYDVHNPYVHNRYPHYPFNGGPRTPGFYAPPAGMFQHNPSGAAASGLAPNHHPHGMPGSPHPHFADQRNANNMYSMMDPPLQAGMPGFSSPSLPDWSSTPSSDFERRSSSQFSGGITPFPGRFGNSNARTLGDNRGPVRRMETGNVELPRHLSSPGRRTSYERPHQPGLQPMGGSERPLAALLSAPARRSDRSASPRTSNRRSFDNYSTDLSRSSNGSDTSEATHTHVHRARRPRITGMGSSYRRQMMAAPDPNVPSPSQMQALRDKLRHLLPSELPEGTSTACDICQKDYAEKYVQQPSEDEEMAIQLPCKHIFGEHCINTWFETCKTHKNKITCPMCRKLLIEPVRSPHEMLRIMSSTDRHFVIDLLRSGGGELLEELTTRDLEGDFAHT